MNTPGNTQIKLASSHISVRRLSAYILFVSARMHRLDDHVQQIRPCFARCSHISPTYIYQAIKPHLKVKAASGFKPDVCSLMCMLVCVWRSKCGLRGGRGWGVFHMYSTWTEPVDCPLPPLPFILVSIAGGRFLPVESYSE